MSCQYITKTSPSSRGGTGTGTGTGTVPPLPHQLLTVTKFSLEVNMRPFI